MGLTSWLLFDVVVELCDRGIIFIDAFLNMTVRDWGCWLFPHVDSAPVNEPILVLSWPQSAVWHRSYRTKQPWASRHTGPQVAFFIGNPSHTCKVSCCSPRQLVLYKTFKEKLQASSRLHNYKSNIFGDRNGGCTREGAVNGYEQDMQLWKRTCTAEGLRLF